MAVPSANNSTLPPPANVAASGGVNGLHHAIFPVSEAAPSVPAATSAALPLQRASASEEQDGLLLAAALGGLPASASARRMLKAIVPAEPLILATDPPEHPQLTASSPTWQQTIVSPFSALAAQQRALELCQVAGCSHVHVRECCAMALVCQLR